MIQDVLQRIGGVENYGLISIGLFFACFIGILIWALRLRKSHLQAMAELPLEHDPEDPQPRESSHE